jgi:prepilin-type N-terminal cleavage/methylation domain-containing protein
VLTVGVRGRARGDAGFTLPELLISTAAALVLLGGALTVTVAGVRSEPRASERSAEIQQARVLMDRVTRELRQGATVLEATTGHLRLITYVSSETCGGVAASTARSCMVTYDCAAGTCTRIESDAEGTTSGPPTVETTGLSVDPVFTYLPSAASARYVGITFEFPAADGDDSITLSDGVTLRNPAPPPT